MFYDVHQRDKKELEKEKDEKHSLMVIRQQADIVLGATFRQMQENISECMTNLKTESQSVNDLKQSLSEETKTFQNTIKNITESFKTCQSDFNELKERQKIVSESMADVF